MLKPKLCTHCHAQSPATATRCKCGKPLPKFSNAESETPTRSYQPLSSASEQHPKHLASRSPSESYIARYWQGELPLAHSFWITNCTVDLCVALLDKWLDSYVVTAQNELLFQRVSLTFELFTIFVLGIWQVVGLWRSARQYVAYAESPLWGRGAQVLVFLWACVMTLTYPVWLPGYVAGIRIAFGDKDFQYQLAVSENGSALELNGGLGLGVTRAVTEHLYHNPGVELLALNSRGGLLEESRELGALIEERELSTYSNGECLSACTTPFLAGKQRILHADAKLGFQKSRIFGMPESVNDLRNAPDKEFMSRQGVHEDFVEKAFGASNKHIWIPTLQELVDAGVVTHVYDGNRTVAYSK